MLESVPPSSKSRSRRLRHRRIFVSSIISINLNAKLSCLPTILVNSVRNHVRGLTVVSVVTLHVGFKIMIGRVQAFHRSQTSKGQKILK